MRGSKLSGFRFRRQHAVDRFIVDFYCREAALVIEVDGPIHDLTAVEDAARQAMLEGQNLTVPRFKNQEVLERLEGVLEVIQSHLPLSVDGEGAGGEVCASS
jgi:adenine-specific DNA-methyltransferase